MIPSVGLSLLLTVIGRGQYDGAWQVHFIESISLGNQNQNHEKPPRQRRFAMLRRLPRQYSVSKSLALPHGGEPWRMGVSGEVGLGG